MFLLAKKKELALKKKRKIRRNPKQKRNMYFNMETQKCIVEYQGLENSKEKETLYKEKIHQKELMA